MKPEDYVIPRLKKAFEKSVEDFERQVKIRTPVDTGRLRRSIHVESVDTVGDTWEGMVATDVEYAGFIEYGVRPLSKNNPKPVYRKKGPAAMFRRGKVVAEVRMKKRVHKALKRGINDYLKNI